MNYLSIFSGIEAATVAFSPLHFTPLAFAETDPYSSSILSHHYPNIDNLGDVLHYKQWPDLKPDIIIGGTPCESFSVAGLRKGLHDPRGRLVFGYLGVVDRYKPPWVIFENVPGMAYLDGGQAISSFLAALEELGYRWAYRTLDSQHVRIHGFEGAVPQRRRRIYIVGYTGDWRCPAAVLFDSESLSLHPAQSKNKGKNGIDTRTVADPITANERRTQTHEGKSFRLRNVIPAITARSYRHEGIVGDPAPRRLTPLECERLMGFPDHYTFGSDTQRYKSLGKSMPVNVIRWLGYRIQCVEDILGFSSAITRRPPTTHRQLFPNKSYK